MQSPYIRWFSESSLQDLSMVGGKNASLGEMYQYLSGQNIRVPNGFAITTAAYDALIESNQLADQLWPALESLDADDQRALHACAEQCQSLMAQARLPQDVLTAIEAAFGQLEEEYGASLTVAVRSSATAEDLPEASFAGQHESFLNVSRAALLDACSRCYASLFTPRAIRYRVNNGIGHRSVGLSIGVMKMVRADLGASGVTFTLDTDSGHRGVVYTTSIYGLGELLVKGEVEPDEFYVHKDRLAQGFRSVMSRRRGEKARKMILDADGVHSVSTSAEERAGYSLDDAQVVELAEIAVHIEQHYSEQTGHSMPMDIEWAADGLDGQLYVLQARPETVASQRAANMLERFQLSDTACAPVLSGRAVGHQIAVGTVRIVCTSEDLQAMQPGEVLVAATTSPDWGTVMQKAGAIITDQGGRTCHAAIVARELAVPAVVGTGNATELLHDGEMVTVACHEGQTGRVYPSALEFTRLAQDLDEIARPETQIMLNVGNPDVALKTSMLPNDGVGLARLEFIISNHVKLHPMAAVFPERLEAVEQDKVKQLTLSYASPADYFVSTLAEGIAAIAGAFFPKPVIVRLSDFKTNEYAALLGGRVFEPEESNPMIGWRGASRYAHPDYREGFALECAAFKRVREQMGFDNVHAMVPFCRRVEEGRNTLAEMARHGLRRSDAFQIYLMCEIPNNVILIDEFAQDFDGFSIGSNDLTQLTLGVDRDSSLVAFDFDERDPGVMMMLRMAIEGAKRNNRYISICGQAPSDYPEVAAFLVVLGIDALSLTPDSLLATMTEIGALEQRLAAHTK